MSKKQELLDYIAEIKGETEKIKKLRKSQDLASIAQELRFIRDRKAAALERITEQEAAGDKASARRSRKAYNFCSKYEKQLANILEGYKAHPGKHFTKDGTNRYVNSIEPPQK